MAVDSWQSRESAKQARCREQNESTARARLAPVSTDGGGGSFRCECGDPRCSRAITLTPSEYERVRGSATHFAVARNHENPEREAVVQESADFTIVEVISREATKLAGRSDPRQRRRERRWDEAARSGRAGEGR